jgi:hypothetical protein
LDGLVKRGVLINDTPKYVRSLYHDFLVDKNEPRVEITLTEI